MKITFTARRFTASDRLQAYAEEAFAKLGKFHDSIQDITIIAEPGEEKTAPQKIEATLNIPNATLVASEAAETYEFAIGKVIDNLKRQLIKRKEKQMAR